MLFMPRDRNEYRSLLFMDDLKHKRTVSGTDPINFKMFKPRRSSEVMSYLVDVDLPKGMNPIKLTEKFNIDLITFNKIVVAAKELTKKNTVTYLNKQTLVRDEKSLIYRIPVVIAKLVGCGYESDFVDYLPVKFIDKCTEGKIEGYRLGDVIAVSLICTHRTVVIKNKSANSSIWVITYKTGKRSFTREIFKHIDNQDITLKMIRETLIEAY